MNGTLKIVATTLIAFSALASAEMPKAGVLNLLVKQALGQNFVHSEGLALQEATSRALARSGNSLTLAHEGYLFVEATSDKQNSIVVRAVRKETEVRGHFPGIAPTPTYRSPGEIEIGISRVIKDQNKLNEIATAIRESTCERVLDPNDRFYSATFADDPASVEAAKMFVKFEDVLSQYGQTPKDVMVHGFSRLVRNDDGSFSMIRNFRFDASKLKAGETERLIRAANKLL